MDEGGSIELVVLAVKDTAARCRPLAGGPTVTLRTNDLWNMIPGEIVTVVPRMSAPFR